MRETRCVGAVVVQEDLEKWVNKDVKRLRLPLMKPSPSGGERIISHR